MISPTAIIVQKEINRDYTVIDRARQKNLRFENKEEALTFGRALAKEKGVDFINNSWPTSEL